MQFLRKNYNDNEFEILIKKLVEQYKLSNFLVILTVDLMEQ